MDAESKPLISNRNAQQNGIHTTINNVSSKLKYCPAKIQQIAAWSLNWVFVIVIWLLASIPLPIGAAYYIIVYCCPQKGCCPTCDNQPQNCYLASGLIINSSIIIVVLHTFHVWHDVNVVETAVVAFMFCVAVLLIYEKHLINHHPDAPDSGDKKETLTYQSSISQRQQQTVDQKIKKIADRIENIEPKLHELETMINELYNTEKKEHEPMIKSNIITQFNMPIIGSVPSINNSDMPMMRKPETDMQSNKSVTKFEQTLFEWLNIEEKNKLTVKQLNNVVIHYALISAVFALFIAYITNGIIEWKNNKDLKITYTQFYQFMAIVLANFLGGKKVIDQIANWFAKNWKTCNEQ